MYKKKDVLDIYINGSLFSKYTKNIHKIFISIHKTQQNYILHNIHKQYNQSLFFIISNKGEMYMLESTLNTLS